MGTHSGAYKKAFKPNPKRSPCYQANASEKKTFHFIPTRTFCCAGRSVETSADFSPTSVRYLSQSTCRRFLGIVYGRNFGNSTKMNSSSSIWWPVSRA